MQALRTLLSAVISLLVTVLPERLKSRDPVADFASVGMHVVSGVVETFGSAILLIVGIIAYVSEFNANYGIVFLTSRPNLDEGLFFGVGALAAVSFLLKPTSLLLIWCFGEGIIRTVEAALSDRQLGLGVVWLAWQTFEVLRARGQAIREAVLLGPRRPDEVVMPESSTSGLLEIYSVEDKFWSENQVVVLGDEFFILQERAMVPRGRHHAQRYRLRRMEEREVIRGSIVQLDPSSRE